MNGNNIHRRAARKLAEQVVRELKQTTGDDTTYRAAIRLRNRLKHPPLSIILDKVPGVTVAARARLLGISQQTYYSWASGVSRPDREQAQRLASATGVMLADFRGALTEENET